MIRTVMAESGPNRAAHGAVDGCDPSGGKYARSKSRAAAKGSGNVRWSDCRKMHFRLRIARSCLVWFGAALAVTAAPAAALTIEEALAAAAASNPGLVAVREAARARHQDVPEAVSAWLPTLQFNASAGRQRTAYDQAFLPGTDPTLYSAPRSWTFSIRQNLFRSGRDSAALRRAVQGVSGSHASVEDREQSVLLRAATAYLDTLRAEQVVELRAASLAALNAQVRDVKAQYNVGDRTGADVAQAEAEREIAAAEMVAATTELEVHRARFIQLTGLTPDGLEAVSLPAGLPQTLEDAHRIARTQRPAVRVAEAATRAAEASVGVATAELGPRIDLIAAAKRQSGATFPGSAMALPGSTEMSLQLQLTVPLYQAGAAGSRIRRARHVQAQRRNEWLDAVRNASQLVESAWRNLAAARQRQAAFAIAVNASRAALAGIQREAEFGERTTREVLDAERRVVTRQISALSAERDVTVEAYRLLEAVGALTSQKLGIAGVPDLTREARDAKWKLAPGILYMK